MTRPDDSDLPLARLRDLVAPGRLLLVGFAFWTAFALIFSIEYWLLAIPEAFPRIVASQLASWWPCALLTPPLAAGTIRIRALGLPRARALLLHAAGAAAFVIVGGALLIRLGLTRGLVKAVVTKTWGCDCIFFLSYSSINRALSAGVFSSHMEALFGKKRAADLEAKMQSIQGPTAINRASARRSSLRRSERRWRS